MGSLTRVNLTRLELAFEILKSSASPPLNWPSVDRAGSAKSVIDFVIISNDLINHLVKIHIDEENANVLIKMN